MRSWREDGPWIAAIAVLLLYSFPYFPEIRSANELPRAYLTWAMVEEGTFAIDSGVQAWGATADMSPSSGHVYSNKAPGSSILAVPGYLVLRAVKRAGGGEPTLAEIVWVCRVTTGVLPTVAFLFLLSAFLGRYAPRPNVRRMVLAAYALGSMAMTYSVLFIAHQLSAVCIATSYFVAVWVVDKKLARGWLFAVGLAAGSAVLVDYQAAFAGVPISIWLLWRLWRETSWTAPEKARALLLAAAGAAVPVAVLLYYHSAAFGSPWATGYAASETFAHHHQRGFLGLDRFRFEALYGSLLAPDNGLFIFSPVLLAAFPGWWQMFREPGQRGAAAVTMAVFLIYVGFISSLVFWRGGWQMGPRYITVLLPFAMVPVAAFATWAEARWWTAGLWLGAALVGMVVYSLSCAQYPHFPEKFDNPLYEVTFRLYREGRAPYNAGWLLGLRGTWSQLPYLVGLFGLVALLLRPWRTHWRVVALAVGLAAAVVASYSLFPGGGELADAAYTRWVAGVMPSE